MTAPPVTRGERAGTSGTLPPELPVALEGAGRAERRALLRLVRTLGRHGSRWQGSALTGDGFPLELGFRSGDRAVRLTLDPAAFGPAYRASPRAALAALAPIDPPAAERLAERVAAADLGHAPFAWIGARAASPGLGFKLYLGLEGEDDAGRAVARLGLLFPVCADVPLRPRLIALEPASARVELYCRAHVVPGELGALLAPAALARRAGAITDLIEHGHGRRLRGRFPGGVLGVSYRVAPGEPLPVVTLYLFARALWGSDRRVRERMLAHLDGAGGPLAAYAAASAPIARRASARTRHAMVGITPDADGVRWSVGLRPTLS